MSIVAKKISFKINIIVTIEKVNVCFVAICSSSQKKCWYRLFKIRDHVIFMKEPTKSNLPNLFSITKDI